jgi:hypothetical protein
MIVDTLGLVRCHELDSDVNGGNKCVVCATSSHLSRRDWLVNVL